MSFLPDFDTDFKELNELVCTAIQGHLLMLSLKMKIFDQLELPVTATELAQAIDSSPHNCRTLLNALVACGYACKKKTFYFNTTLSKNYLASSGSAYIGDLLQVLWERQVAPLAFAEKMLKQSYKPKDNDQFGKEELWAEMANVNAQYARAGLAQLAVEHLSSLPGFNSMGKMLDLGGGPGLVAMALAEANPGLEAIVLDRPAVVKVAQQYIDLYKMSDRVKTIGADYATDDIGKEYDLIWASATLNFYHDDLAPILKKIKQALKPGAIFVCLQDGLTCQGTQPKEMILGALVGALQGQMSSFHQGEIALAMQKAGFKQIRSRTLQTSCGPMDLDVAFK